MENAAAGQGFQAKEEIVQKLITLGFSRNAAVKVSQFVLFFKFFEREFTILVAIALKSKQNLHSARSRVQSSPGKQCCVLEQDTLSPLLCTG